MHVSGLIEGRIEMRQRPQTLIPEAQIIPWIGGFRLNTEIKFLSSIHYNSTITILTSEYLVSDSSYQKN